MTDAPSESAVGPFGKVLVAVATYNEMENLPPLVDALFESVPWCDLLVVDDNSPDGTGRWASERAEEDSRVHALVRTNERGLGTAVVAALRYAVDHDYDYVVNMDADFSHPVDRIEPLVRKADTDAVDVVIGSRYVSGGAVKGWSLKRKFMSRGINAYARILLRLKTKDNSGSFRCYRVATLRKIDFDAIRSRGYSFFEEMLYRLKQAGASFAEIPIVFVDRARGVSKIDRKEAVTALWTLFLIGIGAKK